jgi:hypothetical protein
MIQTEEVPYGYSIDMSTDLSNIDLSDVSINLIPISVEVLPHKAYLIDEPIHSSYLNFQIFRLSENRDIERNNHQIIMQRIKCIFYTLISIPITIILLGYISIIWEREHR